MSAIQRTLEVTSAPAQAMLEALARLGGIARSPWAAQRFALPEPDASDSVAVEALQFTADEAEQMRGRLEQSGLDVLLPGGLDCLPDITASVPWPLKPFVRLALPRNYRQLARHLAGNLDWYLDPQDTPVRLHPFAPWFSLLSIAGSVWFFLGALKWLSSGIYWFPSYAAVTVAILAMCVPTRVLIVFGIVLPLSQLKPSQQGRFNARQLYYYLLDSYADWD